jgi:hypothetical protein
MAVHKYVGQSRQAVGDEVSKWEVEGEATVWGHVPDDHAPDAQLIAGGLVGLVEERAGNAVRGRQSASRV